MLGDRYLKEQDVGFTAEPYVSEGLGLDPQDEALLVVASDGLWDVVPQERVAALAAKAAAGAGAAGGRESCEVPGQQGTAAAGGGSCCKQDGGTCGGAAGAAGTAAAAGGEGGGVAGVGGSDSSRGVQGLQQPRCSVAAVVAEALMQAALRLHSKDDISIMVLHVLPAAAADERRQALLGRASPS